MTDCLPEMDMALGHAAEEIKADISSHKQQFLARLWKKDVTLWREKPEPEIADRLGWLELPERMREEMQTLESFAQKVKDEGFSHILLLGMGGSSLAAEVFKQTFGSAPAYPEFAVLDSTHPQAVLSAERKLNMARTLFVVSSKSGSTLETLSLFHYFFEKSRKATDTPGRHFAAITDPETPLQEIARKLKLRALFTAYPDVGGRFSALSHFGLLPASLMGLKLHGFLESARRQQEIERSSGRGKVTGYDLGMALGKLALSGRDKVVLYATKSLSTFPFWLEQLLAESTGKEGKGVIPVAAGLPLPDDLKALDRVFVFFFLEGDDPSILEKHRAQLLAEAQPVITIKLPDPMCLGAEMFRWEVATAALGHVFKINPFNQPDVQLAKDFAREAMEKGKALSEADETIPVSSQEELNSALKKWLDGAAFDSYIALLAFLNPGDEHKKLLEELKRLLQKKTGKTTTFGFGPRYLHSTGQLHKGGPRKGLFLQLIDEPAEDVRVAGKDYTFSQLLKAQAHGDIQALRLCGQRVLCVQLGAEPSQGLKELFALLEANF